MAKNVVIFSDGTGQRGGISFDEVRTNIFKLYRATRCGPDSSIDPDRQVAFYDAGIGTMLPGIGFMGAVYSWLRNLVCQATGLGLTRNIRLCYAAIIALYQPGDRIFLFGFSRGAYTVRCLAAVLALCGVPTRTADGTPLRRDSVTGRKIAREAVTRVYQHVSSPRDLKYAEQRRLVAARFRKQFGSEGDSADTTNCYPHFIGVFETVAAVGSTDSIILLVLLASAGLAIAATLSWLFLGISWFVSLVAAIVFTGLVCVVCYVWTHVKVAFGLDYIPWWKTLHLTSARMRFADEQLNLRVGWARHAISIDERRGDFARVRWAMRDVLRAVQPGEPEWLQQVWFAGNHADIGGGYEENESRLSDIALDWMLSAAMAIPGPIEIDKSVLQLSPRADGPQHDEATRWMYWLTAKKVRDPDHNAPLHPSVAQRFAAPGVLQSGELKPYRPEALKNHDNFADFYK